MTELIELTKAEHEAAAEAAYIAHEMAVRGDGKAAPWGNQVWSQDKWRGSIAAALAAINRVRAGDPVGTIRRGPTGNVSVRVTTFNEYELPILRWAHVSISSGDVSTPNHDHDCDWPVVYSPEEA